MPRIPEADIERIKRETDLVALVRSRGVELNKHGSKDFVGKCPFHKDTKKPNFIVSPAKGLFHCMMCGKAGNPIQFVQHYDGVSFRHAFEILDAGKPAFSAPAAAPLKQASIPRLDCPLDAQADDATLFRQVTDYYHERLWQTPAALDYLQKRGVRHEETLKLFRIGFADRTLGLRLPESNRKEGEQLRCRLIQLGLWRGSGHEHFNGSVVFPIADTAGAIRGMYGRKIRDDLRPGTATHLYLPGPHVGIWNAAALDTGELILCEALFDALTFYVNGFKNVTFIYGTEGFTAELFDALLARKICRVHLAYDADEAGNRATERDAKKLMAHGIECFRVKFPWGMDANEYACKVKPPDRSLALLIHSAEWLGGSAERKPIPPPLSSPPVLPPVVPPSSDSSHAPAPAPSSLAACLAAKEKTPLLEKVGEHHLLHLGEREYRVGGLDKNNSLEVLKITLRLMHMGQGSALFHLDSFDMARDGERRRFIERAAEETRLEPDLVKRDLGKLLLALEQTQTARIQAALTSDGESHQPEMSLQEKNDALNFLKATDLIERITEVFPICGLAGEARSSLACYLACTSRKLDKPLAVIIQSTSAAGKSTLMDAVLSLFPEEERIKYSAMTGQSLYYLGETNLKHKILAIVEEEGAEKASYALKLLQSEGELTIASTGKDPTTGKMVTQEYHVQGPVMIFLTTTAVDIDEELLNRCLILTVDESREQTERIHALQRQSRTLEGLVAKEQKKDTARLLRNAQRLLRPLAVVNSYAAELTFTATRTRTRRDHEKYLTLIDTIALLHQCQRPLETRTVNGREIPFVRATLEDIALANELAPELLGRSLDELPPQTRRVYDCIKQVVRERCDREKLEQSVAFFSRREIRAILGWSVTQIRMHLERLLELEYIEARYGRQGNAYQYVLLTDCHETSDQTHIGLLEVEKLRLRQPACLEKETLDGACRKAPRQVQSVENQSFKVTLSGCRNRTSGAPVAVMAS